jgi:hypothetical protein
MIIGIGENLVNSGACGKDGRVAAILRPQGEHPADFGAKTVIRLSKSPLAALAA